MAAKASVHCSAVAPGAAHQQNQPSAVTPALHATLGVQLIRRQQQQIIEQTAKQTERFIGTTCPARRDRPRQASHFHFSLFPTDIFAGTTQNPNKDPQHVTADKTTRQQDEPQPQPSDKQAQLQYPHISSSRVKCVYNWIITNINNLPQLHPSAPLW